MASVFGFSVRDFIIFIGMYKMIFSFSLLASSECLLMAIELCAKVARALKNTDGASSDYQNIIIELHSLQNVLTRLTALESTESNISHVNVIHSMALVCWLSLC